MINAINSNPSFTGIKFHGIGSRAKERTFLNTVAQGVLKDQLDFLEKKGINFDLVRYYDFMSRPTKNISLYMSHTPDYFTKDGMNPIQNVSMQINNLEDAQKLLAKGIKEAKKFLPKHLKYIKRAKELGSIE